MTVALDQTILERHSIRKFLPAPVPRDLLDEGLALAQHAPSNSNIQPWRLVFASGAARDRLKEALLKVADHEAPHIPALPKAFEQYRYELGAAVYGSMGIPIADTARPAAAVMRNFEFFGAPLAGIVCMLALTARGLGTCVEVSVAGYPDVVRAELNIAPELTITCGLAVGYPDPDGVSRTEVAVASRALHSTRAFSALRQWQMISSAYLSNGMSGKLRPIHMSKT